MNVFTQGIILLIDFGMAQHLDSSDHADSFRGSPLYMVCRECVCVSVCLSFCLSVFLSVSMCVCVLSVYLYSRRPLRYSWQIIMMPK